MNKSKAVDLLSNMMAILSLEFGVDWREFMERYKRALVQQALKSNPELGKVGVATVCSIDRKTMDRYLSSEIQKPWISKVELAMVEILNFCEKNQTRMIKKRGPFDSFEEIVHKVVHGTLTPRSLVTELLSLKFLLEFEGYYLLNVLEYKQVTEDREREFVDVAIRLEQMFTDIMAGEVPDVFVEPAQACFEKHTKPKQC